MKSNWCEYDHDLSVRLYQLWRRRLTILREMNMLIEISIHAKSFLPYTSAAFGVPESPTPTRIRRLRALSDEVTEQIDRVHEMIEEIRRTPPPLTAADRVRDRINAIAAEHNIDLWEDQKLGALMSSGDEGGTTYLVRRT
jgi:hypothetical protein